MAISRAEVLHVARLARLNLEDSEIERFQRELDAIVAYVTELRKVDTEGVPPTAQIAVERAPLREDRAEPGLSHEAALRAAPRAAEECFAVPAFVDEG